MKLCSLSRDNPPESCACSSSSTTPNMALCLGSAVDGVINVNIVVLLMLLNMFLKLIIILLLYKLCYLLLMMLLIMLIC